MTNLKPQHGVWFINPSGASWLEPAEISSQIIGAKAFGLTTIPEIWTLPFFVIGADLFEIAKQNKGDPSSILTSDCQSTVSSVADKLLFQSQDLVFLRSSAVNEGVEERGRFHSEAGPLKNIVQLIRNCCMSLVHDPDTAKATVCFILQKHANPIRLRGHLSNERRLAKETRDWVYQSEDAIDGTLDDGQIAIRPWREGIFRKPEPLACQYVVSLAQILREPARWAHYQGQRIHFEWVWNGDRVYLVQADAVSHASGADPRRVAASLAQPVPNLELRAFRLITEQDGKRFPKVENVLIYQRLEIPTTDLFILDRVDVFEALKSGTVPEDLIHDLELLTKRSLVLRTDLDTDNLDQRQMLPRTDEIRAVPQAIDHLVFTIEKTSASGCPMSQLAILAHHFIPAVTSAWSYAEPKSRKVLIESLWGIPEGLYYYSHDTFEVDTLSTEAKLLSHKDKEKFSVVDRIRYKHHFVSPTATGEWKANTIGEPLDWRPSIRERSWVTEIAYQSRKIADHVGAPLNIMWFVDLPRITRLPKVLPWYHQKADQRPKVRRTVGRKKLVTERDPCIETVDDIAELERSAQQGIVTVKRIRIRPKDAAVLREKEFPRLIGELAKKLRAVIVLEGGLLSHAYYMLCRTGAEVETVDSFLGEDDVREFHKLVRDLIPTQIANYGEEVTVARLRGDELLRALRIKLAEETIEALDATGYDSLVEELADVLEVLDSLRKRLKLGKHDLENTQRKKRKAKGGFSEGYVLVETRNPPIAEQNTKHETENLFEDSSQAGQGIRNVKTYQPAAQLLQRSIDKRQLAHSVENMLTLEVPLVADKWEAVTGEFSVCDSHQRTVTLRSRLVGKRIGSVLRLELSVITSPNQLTLKFVRSPQDNET